MRHHGIPTTLLDWSESFICSLYFANYNRDPNTEAAIYILDAEKLNKKTLGTSGLVSLFETSMNRVRFNPSQYHPKYIKDEKVNLGTIAVTPVLTNSRMIAQESVFTVCGDSFDPLEETYSDFITKIVLPANTYSDSMEYLKFLGIKHFNFFPDLDGISIDIIHHLQQEEDQLENFLNKMNKG